MPQYKFGNDVYEEQKVIEAAQKSNLSVPKYIEEFGIKKVEPKIIYKPKTPEEATASAYTIKNSINKNSSEVSKNLADKYFDLSGMKRKKSSQKMAGTPLFDFRKDKDKYENSLDTDIKNYFSEVTQAPFASQSYIGPDIPKYESYKNYQETGNFDLNLVSNSMLQDAIKQEQKKKVQLYIAGINNNEIRKVAAADLDEGVYDDIDPTAINPSTGALWIDEYKNALTEDRKILYPSDFADPSEPMKKRGTPMYGRSTEDKEKFELKTQIYKGQGKSNTVLQNYLSFKRDEIITLRNNYKTTSDEFNKTVVEQYVPDIENLVNQITDLNINANSPAEDKSKALELYGSYENIMTEYRTALSNQRLVAESIDLTSQEFLETTSKLDDSQFLAQAFALDYTFSGGALLSIEKGLVDMAGLAIKAGDYLEEIPEFLFNYGTNFAGLKEDLDIELFGNIHNDVIDYQESLNKHTEAARPLNIKWEDVKFSGPGANFGEAANQLFANNIFSIGSALTYGGVIKLGGKAVVAPATKYLTRLFFGLEGGSKLSEMEISQKNAQENINFYNSELTKATTVDERISILKQIELAQNQLNYTELQKAFSSIMYGGIAAYAEKFGTMSYVQKLALLSKSDIAGVSIGNALKGAGGFGYNTGIEYIEEAFTQVGHNLVDYGVLGENKSLIEGIDADFNMNVLFSTMAIQGPSVAGNVVNSVRSDISTRQEINANQKRTKEFAEISAQLQTLYKGPNIEKTDLEVYLESELMRILREAQVQDAAVFADVSNMDNQDIFALFEAQRKKRDLRKKAQQIGAAQSGQKYNQTIANDVKIIQQQIDDIDQEITSLRDKPSKDQKEKFNDLAERINVDTKNIKAEDYFFFGKFYESLSMVLGLEGSVLKAETFEDAEALLKEKGASQEQIENYMAGFRDRGANASYFGNDIIVVEQNVVNNIINAPTSYDKSTMAFAVFHELTHQNDARIKLFEDIETRGLNEELTKDIELLLEQVEDKQVYNRILNRLNVYKSKGDKTYLAELTPILAELQDAGLVKENTSFIVSLKLLLNEAINKYHGGKQPMYFKFNNAADINAYIASFRKGVRENNLIVAGTTPEGDAVFSEDTQRTPEKLIRQIKKLSKLPNFKDNPQYRKDYAELLAQYNLLALNAIKFVDPKSKDAVGDIPRENAVSALSIYLPGLIKRYVPGKGKFSTFVTANIAPKDDTIYEDAKILQIRDSVKLDDPNIKDVAGDVNDTTNTQETFVQKIDMFEDFSIVSTKSDNIKSKIKVKEGNDFKEVIDNNAGQVGEIIFDIAADKIMKGGANLSLVTKYKEGMPIPAEAQSIQRVFNAGENASKFIKTLPLLNVTRKTADINKIGENIDVSREIYGRAIGLKGLVMDYFYEDYTDPKATSTDRATKKDAETSPGGRSLGLSTQTSVKILKPQFRNPTPDTIEKFKKDLGITPKNEPNVFDRDIGQFLKSNAKAFSIGVSLAGAQRKLEQAGAAKLDIAKVTAAQGKAAFSEAFTEVDGLMVKNTLELEEKGIDNVLQARGQGKTYNLKTDAGRKQFLESMPVHLFPHMPKEFWIKDGIDVFTGSNKNYGVSMSEFKKDGTRNPDYSKEAAEAYNKFRNDVRTLAQNTDDSVFGEPVDKANWDIVKNYGTIFGTKKTYRTKLADKKRIKKWNKDIALIHKVMWERFNTAITQDETGETVRAIGSYLKLTANDKKSWQRLGAQIAGYSLKITGGKIEFEHAMPATAAYLYLMNSILDERVDSFEVAYDLVIKNYKLIVLDKAMDNKLTKARTARGYSLQKRMPDDWSVLDNNWWERYFNEIVFNADGVGIDPNSIVGLDGKTTFAEMFNVNNKGANKALDTQIQQRELFSEAATNARGYNKNTKARGMSAFDFDETVGVSQNYVIATKDGETKRIASDQWPFVGDELLQQGWKMDFTDFNKVTDGKPGPLMQKMKNQIKKFGPENVFILTARAPESQQAIHEYLKSEGINIPLENITGLGNSTGEAKALWMLNKFAEGYNDMYFVDDALPNVTAVKNVLEQLDIKSKVVQAKINFSEGLNEEFNQILEDVSGIDAKKRFGFIKARKRGAGKGKFRLFIPPSHEDFVGLLYNFMGKGALGNKHRDFFEEALIRPLNRANREYDTARQSVATDYKNLNKAMPDVKKMLNQKTPDGDFVYQDAVRVYLWDKHGYSIPGLSETDQKALVELVNSDPSLKSYAEAINTISKQDKYVDPTDGWDSGDIRMDLDDATGRIGRAQFFEKFIENADTIFSTENLNKIEAGYGKGMREALEDILYRIKTGRNKPTGQSGMVNNLMNWVNGSVGSVMFFNVRSSLLQQMSIVNYINFADNNVYAAAKAFANQKQYWNDWSFIFNSDMLKQRRGGIMTDVNGAELAAEMRKSKNPHRFLISKLLELGFLPTQIGDNIAIATGGATYYRNRINTYLSQGLSKKEAEAKAFTDFQDITQSTQQSARPDMVSKQQASIIGKVILNFQNVTSQFNRLAKKAFLDIKNRRITKPNTTQMQSDISNAARITYYLAIQNLIFYTLQTAMFAMMFDDDEEDVNNLFLKKRERLINGSIDSVLRGTGMFGAILSTLKNTAIAYARQRDVNYNPDESAVLVEALNFSPVLGIKARKIVNAEKTLNYNKKVMAQMNDFDIDNPQWSAATNYVEGFTNLPLNRLYNKTQNVRQALNNEHAAWERTLMFLGWSQYNLNIKNEKIEALKAKKKRKRKILR